MAILYFGALLTLADPSRRWHRTEGVRVSREHSGRKHHHGLRQLYEGDKWCGRSETESWTHGAEPSVFAIFHLVPTEQLSKDRHKLRP